MPAPWITLTLANLETGKAAPLVAALRTAALGETQGDPLPEAITTVTNRIRMEIAAGGRTVLDADGTRLPPSLKSLAIRMVLREGQSRLNAVGALPLSDDEREEARQDIRFLERIARGEITVEASTNPESVPTVQAAVASPLIGERSGGEWGRAAQDGV